MRQEIIVVFALASVTFALSSGKYKRESAALPDAATSSFNAAASGGSSKGAILQMLQTFQNKAPSKMNCDTTNSMISHFQGSDLGSSAPASEINEVRAKREPASSTAASSSSAAFGSSSNQFTQMMHNFQNQGFGGMNSAQINSMISQFHEHLPSGTGSFPALGSSASASEYNEVREESESSTASTSAAESSATSGGFNAEQMNALYEKIKGYLIRYPESEH